jgi:hypothetical protein
MTTPARLSRAIYGNVLSMSLVVAFSEDEDYSSGDVALAVFAAGLVFWIAHVYASVLAERYSAARRLTWSEVGAEFAAEWPVAQAFVPPVIVLLLGAIGVLSDGTAETIAIAGGVVAMVLWALAIGRRERMSPSGLVVMALVNAVLGVAIVLLKVLVH